MDYTNFSLVNSFSRPLFITDNLLILPEAHVLLGIKLQ